jgi:hypothetical protein
VHARLRDADRPFDYDYSTVLHALQTLTEQGLAHILTTGGVAAYGIADRPHHHAICISCAQVTELDADQLAAHEVTEWPARSPRRIPVPIMLCTASGFCRRPIHLTLGTIFHHPHRHRKGQVAVAASGGLMSLSPAPSARGNDGTTLLRSTTEVPARLSSG